MGHTADNFDIDGTLNVDGAVTMASTLAVTGAITSQSVVIPKYQVVAGPSWYQADCTASQSAVAIIRLGGVATTGLTGWMPGRAGSIRRVIVSVESARTAGTLTVQATINGTVVTANGSDCVINGTNTQYNVKELAHGVTGAIFDSNDLVGVKVTTDGDWATAAATPELFVDLVVDYDVAI